MTVLVFVAEAGADLTHRASQLLGADAASAAVLPVDRWGGLDRIHITCPRPEGQWVAEPSLHPVT